MALKPHHKYDVIETKFIGKYVGERGVTLCFDTSGSGEVLGDNHTYVDRLSPSGKVPAGLLLVDIDGTTDLTRFDLNRYKEVQASGTPVPLLTKGYVVTNNVTGTPAAGNTAYLTTNGTLTPTVSATGGTVATPKVGQFQGGLDEDGYVAVQIELPGI